MYQVLSPLFAAAFLLHAVPSWGAEKILHLPTPVGLLSVPNGAVVVYGERIPKEDSHQTALYFQPLDKQGHLQGARKLVRTTSGEVTTLKLVRAGNSLAIGWASTHKNHAIYALQRVSEAGIPDSKIVTLAIENLPSADGRPTFAMVEDGDAVVTARLAGTTQCKDTIRDTGGMRPCQQFVVERLAFDGTRTLLQSGGIAGGETSIDGMLRSGDQVVFGVWGARGAAVKALLIASTRVPGVSIVNPAQCLGNNWMVQCGGVVLAYREESGVDLSPYVADGRVLVLADHQSTHERRGLAITPESQKLPAVGQILPKIATWPQLAADRLSCRGREPVRELTLGDAKKTKLVLRNHQPLVRAEQSLTVDFAKLDEGLYVSVIETFSGSDEVDLVVEPGRCAGTVQK